MKPTPGLHLVSAFLAMEPPDCLLSHARSCGGGSVTEEVQRFIWDHCIAQAIGQCHAPYMKSFLKKLISEIEAKHEDALDELYELYTELMASLKEESLVKVTARALKCISFLFPKGDDEIQHCPLPRKLVVPLQCSLNMLEGDTGCSIWPASLYLSEYILSFPEIFSTKTCFEVGSGVGLVGICLTHVKASKVILSDGDLSTLTNMKFNLRMNQLNVDDAEPISVESTHSVKCLHMPWESASEAELKSLKPDVILGADITYDPLCLPHLVRLLAILLCRRESLSYTSYDSRNGGVNNDHNDSDDLRRVTDCRDAQNAGPSEDPVGFISCVIRNKDTFDHFLTLLDKVSLAITDLTETFRPINLLPYMHSYDRSSIRLFKLSRK